MKTKDLKTNVQGVTADGIWNGRQLTERLDWADGTQAEREYVDSYDIPEEKITSLKLALFAATCLIIMGLVVLGVWLIGLITTN